jgi:hypothetical protein
MMSTPDYDVAKPKSETTGITVVSLLPHRTAAEAAVRDLKSAGFGDEQIGLVMQDSGKPTIEPDLDPDNTQPAVVGAVNGGLIGGLVGLLGSLLIPGLGPLLLGGVLASTLTGAGIGAATGGLIGILTALGVSESDAERFERGLRAGGILLTVSAAERTPEALAIIERHGADLGKVNRRSGNDPDYSGPERRLIGV